MPDPALAEKMKCKPGGRAAIIGAPERYESTSFGGLGHVATSLAGSFDWIQIFVRNEAELRRWAPKAAGALKPEGLLWISFPKGPSKIQTDLTRGEGWDSLRQLDLK